MTTIRFCDDTYVAEAYDGTPIQPSGRVLNLGRDPSYQQQNNGVFYCGLVTNYEESTASINTKVHATGYFGFTNFDPTVYDSRYQTQKLVEVRMKCEVIAENTGTVLDTVYFASGAEPWRGYRLWFSIQARKSKQYGNVGASGNSCIIEGDIPISFSNDLFSVRVTPEYRLNSSASWTPAGAPTIYSSRAPFYNALTVPAHFYGNRLNIFDYIIEAEFRSEIVATSTYYVPSPGNYYQRVGNERVVRNEFYPYVTEGTRTEHLYWYLGALSSEGREVTSILTCSLYAADPVDSSIEICLSKTVVELHPEEAETSDLSDYVSVQCYLSDEHDIYDTYGLFLQNYQNTVTINADVSVSYGLTAYASCVVLGIGTIQICAEGSESGTYSVTVEVWQGYSTLAISYKAYAEGVQYHYGTNYPQIEKILEGSWSVPVLFYFVPTFVNLAIHRCTEDGLLDDNGNYCRIDWSVSIMPIDNQNSKVLIVDHPEGTTIYNPLENYTQSGIIIVAASTESSHTLVFTLSDDLNTETRTLILSSAGVVMDWLYGGSGISFGKVASKKQTVEISEMWKLVCYNLMLANTDMNVWMKQVIARLDGIDQFASNLGLTNQYQVTFYNDSVLLGRQWIRSGEDAEDLDEYPEKEATETVVYTFAGWALVKGATSANPNALKNITAYRNIYAAFSSRTRYYSVFYYNKAELLYSVNDLQYLGSATYSGDTPTSSDGYTFAGWMPSGKYIRDNENAMAQFFENREITDSWEEIIQSIKDKTYKTKYRPGNYKMLDLGTEGTIPMRITSMNTDRIRIGGPTASITWIATKALNTNSMWGYTNTAVRVFEEVDSYFYSKTDTYLTWTAYQYQEDVSIDAVIELQCTLDSGKSFYFNMNVFGDNSTATLTAYENNVQVAQARFSSSNSVHVVGDGTTKVYKFVFTRDSNSSKHNTGRIQCSSSYSKYIEVLSCNKVVAGTHYKSGTSYYGGWEYSKLRKYLSSTIYDMLPTVLKKDGIKEVEKESLSISSRTDSSGGLDYVEACITRDKLWVPSRCEFLGANHQEQNGQDFEMVQSMRTTNKESWLRSLQNTPPYSSSYGVLCLKTDGTLANRQVNYSYGVLIGFSM